MRRRFSPAWRVAPALGGVLSVLLLVGSVGRPWGQTTSSTGPPDVAPGAWAELPGSRLDSVLWRDREGRTLSAIKGSNRPNTIMLAWNGASYDDERGLLVIPAAGGHADYAGNDVYVFDLTTRRWRRDFDPTVDLILHLKRLGPNPSDPGGRQSFPNIYKDDNGTYPVSRHTYNGLVYMPTIGKTWVAGGSRWWDGNGLNEVFFWDHEGRRWEYQARDALPKFPLGITGAWDSVKNRVVYHDHARLRAYDPAAPAGARYSDIDDGRQPNDSQLRFYTSAFDAKRRRFVMGGPRGILYYDFAAEQEGKLKQRQLALRGTPWPQFAAPGFVYDPVGDRYAAYGGGNTVFFVDPDTGEVTAEAGTGAAMTPAAANGTYGRFQFVRRYGMFLVVNGIEENVRVYRPLAATPVKP